MNLTKKKLIGVSILTAFVLQTSLNAKDEKTTETLDSVDVISSNVTEGTDSYTIDSMNTSTKLDLSIRDTPQSVSVITSQKLQDLGISSYQKLLDNVTGVTLNRWDERVQASARGFSIDYYKIDGLPTYKEYNDRDLDLSIYDRVEIVKGANGLTTGSGNPAMSINLVRKRANSKKLKGSVSLSAGSWDSYGITADVGSKLNESGSLRGRVIAKHEDSNSFLDNYDRENNLVYGVVDADLTDTTYLSFGGMYQKLDRSGIRWGGLPAFYTNGSKTNFDRSTNVTEDWTYWDTEEKSLFLDLQQVLYKDVTYNLTYSYDQVNTKTALLYFSGAVNKTTGSGISYMDYQSDEENKQHNLDMNIKIPFEANNLSQQILIGASYNLDKKTKTNARYPNGYYTSLSNFYNYNLLLPSRSSTDVDGSSKPEKTEQKGFYVAGNFNLTEDLKLISGLRISSWEYTSEDSSIDKRKFDNEATPYIGFVYDIDENHSIFISYTSIFQPQSYKDSTGNYLDPVEGNNYELGIKGEYFDGILNTSLTAFRIEQDNVGEDTGLKRGVDTIYKATDGVTSKGIEFDISGKITDNMTLDFGIANFRAKSANGEKFNTKASRTTANLFAKYKLNNVTLGAGLNYKSKYYTGTGSTKITQKAYTIANALVSYKINNNTSLQLNVNNIFDKKYYTGIGTNSMVYGDPRNATLNLKYTF